MKFNTKRTTRTLTVPAPVRGLNFKDSLANMKPTDALVLNNLVCRPSYIEVRKGWQEHVTGIGAEVWTLIPYAPNSGASQLFAAAGTDIYDVTTAGAVGAAVVTGMTNSYWSHTVVSNIGGNALIMVNGVDAGQTYNGTVWGAWGVAGVASTALDFITVWKRRVWAVEKNTFRAWYLAIDAVTGAATSFDFKAIFQRGGRLVALLTWTIDGGSGVDDLFVVVTSEGEVAIYAGTDPASASTFALKGVYFIGKPVGRRFYAKLGGDLLLLTEGGLVALSRYLQSTVVDQTNTLTDSIQRQIALDVADFSTVQGWELAVYFPDNLLFLQVPGGSVGSRYQYVMNTLTGAWSKTLLSDVITFGILSGQLYAGHATLVANTWTSGTDDGDPIEYSMIPAFSYFGAPTKQKRFTLGRAIIEADVSPTYQTKLLRDFDQSFMFPSQATPVLSGALWDSALWDAVLWGGSTIFYRRWYSLTGMAYSASLALQGLSNGTTLRIIALDYNFEDGGLL